jgi:hypothetical protein
MPVTISLDGLFAENALLARMGFLLDVLGKWAVVNAWLKTGIRAL